VRILFFGDMAGTGFGTVTMDMGREMLADHDVRFASMNELGDLPEPFKSRTYVVNDPNGWLALREMGGVNALLDGTAWEDGWIPEACLILGDYEAVRTIVLREENVRAFTRIPTWHYIPVEGIDLPPRWAELWKVVHPVAMSEFGAAELERITGTRPPVVYHGIDTEQFRPLSMTRPLYITAGDDQRKLRSKADCKRFFGGNPDDLWVLRTDRNMPRKRYGSLFRAMAPIIEARPNVFLVTHCRSDDQGGNLDDIRSKYPPRIARRMLNTGFHDQVGGASRDILTALYNAADVYASTSAEGFGLTIAEAIACGTPVVAMDYSAVPEVVGPAGITVPISHLDDNEYDHFWATVNEPVFAQAVLSLIDDPGERKRLGEAGPPHVRENFQWASAARQMGGIIAGRAQESA